MRPVLDQPARCVRRSPVEQWPRIVPQPTEHRQIVAPAEHVHRVDLENPDGVDHPLQMPKGKRWADARRRISPRPVDPETLCCERDSPGLSDPDRLTGQPSTRCAGTNCRSAHRTFCRWARAGSGLSRIGAGGQLLAAVSVGSTASRITP